MRVILTFILSCACILAHGQNFTNKGREFWVGYGHTDFTTSSNIQNFVIYLSAEQAASVTVSIPGTSWVRNYNIAAGNVAVTDLIPKTGPDDCRITDEGLFRKAVHIESNVPIVAYTHMYGQFSSGATMLLPVETYGYTYVSLNTGQNMNNDAYSWFYVIAAEDNTRVRITPINNTKKGRPRDTPFEVDLKKGELYNVMGASNGSAGGDLSGSQALSIPGADGKCHPISIFSGSSRTAICQGPGIPSGDFIMQQVFPATAWGARYLAAVTSSTDGVTILNENRFRIYVRDPATVVYANGQRVRGLVDFSYYDYSSNVSQYITADKPIMVAQMIPSQEGCNNTGQGDPEVIFLSPMEQAIKNVAFYNTNKEAITTNYVTLTIHENGLNSLMIDGSPARDFVYDHPGLPNYKVVVKQFPAVALQHTVTSDSGFNAITYGLGQYESYGYNAGSYINNLTYLAELKNTASAAPNAYTCPGTPFTITIKTLYTLTGITWHFGDVAGFTPASNLVVTNPTLAGTEIVNGKTYNVYQQPVPASVAALGTYYLPITINSPLIDNCSNSERFIYEVIVKAGPTADYTFTPDCAGKPTLFNGTSPDAAVNQWLWDFGDGATAAGQNTNRTYTAGNSYAVKLSASRSIDGCAAIVSKPVVVPTTPTAAFDLPAVVCLPGGESKFVNRSSMPGVNANSLQYKWEFSDGGTATDINPIHYYAARGSYGVTLIATSAAGCADTTTATVATFADRPVAGFDISDPAACAGTAFTFTDQSTIPGNAANASWVWVWGDGTAGTGAAPSKTYKQANTYTVAMHLISSEGCYSDTVSKTVQVHPVPVVDAGPDLITEPGRSVQLKATVTPATADILWTPATALSSATLLQPMATPQENQRYYITATGELGCTSTDSMLVKVFKELKIPNAFSPNGDGRNDTWHIPGLEDYPNATVQIFNRWGQMVYKSTGYSVPWNGSMNGVKLPTGAYYYVIKPNANGYNALSGMVMVVH